MDNDPKADYGDHVMVLSNLYAYRQRPLPRFGKYSVDDKLVIIHKQLDELYGMVEVIKCALNDLWKIVDPSKSPTR